MQIQKKYEILEGLPAYGPMYIPISADGEVFSYEGFVVRFYKKDGTSWVGNFKNGWTKYSKVFELPISDNLVVIANGQGYVIEPESQKLTSSFGGLEITELIATEDNRFIAATNTDLEIIDKDGTVWRSGRISWDGIEKLNIQGAIVSGISYGPMNNDDYGTSFSFNLDTKEIHGGSYIPLQITAVKKPFWKFW
jgi:hypothetical protein